MKKIIKPIAMKEFSEHGPHVRTSILADKINELISAHNERVDRWRERKSLRTDNDGIECLGVDRCQEIALLRAQVKAGERLVEALESIAEAKPNTWDKDMREQFPQWAMNRAKLALENYKTNRGGVHG